MVVNSVSLNPKVAAIEVFLEPWIALASACIARHPLHQKLAAFDYRYSLLHGDLVCGIDVGEQSNPDHQPSLPDEQECTTAGASAEQP